MMNTTPRNAGSGRGNETQCEPLTLPLMRNVNEAYELCRLEQDDFYMSAFFIQLWLTDARARVTAAYTGKKSIHTRRLQSGQTLSALELIEKTDPQIAQKLLSALRRFITFDDRDADLLRDALDRVRLEEVALNPHPTALNRLCDWLDSALHLHTHTLWHRCPFMFHPDPDARHLSSLGYIQRHFNAADAATRSDWQKKFSAAADHFAGSPKLRYIADGFLFNTPRVWNYPDVDTAVIKLWPLVKRHNWTYADLLKTIRPLLKRPEAYPCDRDQNFATYCNLLGLRKTGKGQSSSGELLGVEIARRLLALPA